MFKAIGCAFLSLCFWGSADALVEHKIDEKHPLQVLFSKTSHNRIAVEGGSVEKVFGDDAYFVITVDPTTGNAFVNVLKDIVEVPSILTVVTSFGKIQDLAVRTGDTAAEFLILKESDEEEEFFEPALNLHENTINLLNAILEGRAPQGYGQREVSAQELIRLPAPLIAQGVRAFEGPFENIVVYRIKNTGKDPIVIAPDSLKKDSSSWVFLNAHELKSKEEALCLMAFPKGDN